MRPFTNDACQFFGVNQPWSAINYLSFIHHLPTISLSCIHYLTWGHPHPPALSCWALCFRPKSTGAVPVGQVGSKITCHPGVDRIWNVQKTRYTAILYKWRYLCKSHIGSTTTTESLYVYIYIDIDIDIDIYLSLSLSLYVCISHIYICTYIYATHPLPTNNDKIA